MTPKKKLKVTARAAADKRMQGQEQRQHRSSGKSPGQRVKLAKKTRRISPSIEWITKLSSATIVRWSITNGVPSMSIGARTLEKRQFSPVVCATWNFQTLKVCTFPFSDWFSFRYLIFLFYLQLWRSIKQQLTRVLCSSVTSASAAFCREAHCWCTSPFIRPSWTSSAATVRPKCEHSRSATSTRGYTRPTRHPTNVRSAISSSTRWSICARISNCTPTNTTPTRLESTNNVPSRTSASVLGGPMNRGRCQKKKETQKEK